MHGGKDSSVVSSGGLLTIVDQQQHLPRRQACLGITGWLARQGAGYIFLSSGACCSCGMLASLDMDPGFARLTQPWLYNPPSWTVGVGCAKHRFSIVRAKHCPKSVLRLLQQLDRRLLLCINLLLSL